MSREFTAGGNVAQRTAQVSGDVTVDQGPGSAPANESFDQIVRAHGPMFKRIAASYEADPRLAEELVQEILFALWRALPSFRGSGSIRAFVARIATNRAISHVKRAIRSNETGELSEHLQSPEMTPEAQVVALDERVRLVAAVRSLPLTYRQAVLLTLEGLSAEEVSGVLGISANAVAIRISRAKELLRARMRG
ncbi:MAG: RNA polymerase sigma factor [Steroidobacteraceae bacterium]